MSKDYNKFWNSIAKHNNNKASQFVHVIDGCVVYGEDAAIAERWRSHFIHYIHLSPNLMLIFTS